ncbi:MAG TPA: murein biosynthesis integral membrane protein MurJ, partial [Bryobacteraceae bacterium]
QVVRSAGVVFAAVFLSRLTGLAREMVMANKFGAGFSHDSFLLGFRIPNLTRDLFAEGALSSAFIPSFASSLANGDKRQAAELANLVTTAIVLIVGLLCILGIIFAPQLVWLFAPGFAAVPGKFALAVRLTRIMFPFLPLIALAAQATGMLNSSGSFGIPAAAGIFFNVGSICCGLLLGFVAGPRLGVTAIEGMAYGVVAGGALQLGWQLLKLRSLGFRFRPAWNWSHPGLRHIFHLMLPAIVGNAAIQINVMVNTSFASQLHDPLRGPDGPVSWLAFALRFVQLPLGLFAVAFVSAMLPSVSRSAAAKNFDEFRRTLAHSLGMIFLLTIPSSLALIVLGRPLIGAVYQSGHFQVYDTQQTALALACYSIGLVAYASARVLSPAFYALSDARTPMYISLLSILANIAIPLVLLKVLHMNFAALALTTAIAVTLECLALAECLRRKLGGLEGRYLKDCFLRVTAASMVMAAPLIFLDQQFAEHIPATRSAYCNELAIGVPLGLLIFYCAARFFRVAEIGFASEVFIAPLLRKLNGTHAKIRS